MPTFGEEADEVLRVIGRLAAMVGASLLVFFLVGIVLKPLLPDGLPPGRDGRLIYLIMIASALAVGLLLAGILLERGRWAPTGVGAGAWAPLSLLVAPALGLAAIALPAVLLLLTGRAEFIPEAGSQWSRYAADAFTVIAVVALVQELAFRGYAIGLIAQRWGDVAALVSTSSVAGLIHLWTGAPTLLAFVGAAALAAFLGAVRLRTGSLAASWSAHVAFSFTQVALLHAPLRAAELPAPPGYALAVGQPAWLTGGADGLSEGIAAAASLVLITFLVFRPRPATTRRTRA